MFYLLIFLILVLFGLLEISSIPAVYKKILMIIAFMMIWLVAGLRFETGGDWNAYTKFFQDVEPLDQVLFGKAVVYSSSYMEQAYKLINSTIKLMGGNIQLVFLFVALINSILLFSALKKYTPYPIVGTLIYYCSMYFSLDLVAMRQAVAVMLFFSSLIFILERKLGWFCLIMLIASQFHRSSILLFPLYFFLHKEYSYKSYLILFVFCLSIFFLQIRWMTGLLSVAADVIGGANGGIIKMYISSTAYSANRILSVGVIINVLGFMIYTMNRHELKKFRFYRIFFNIYMINIIVFFVFYEFIEISNRYRSYFLLANVVLMTYFITLYKDTLRKLLVFTGIIAFCFLYGRSIFLESPSAIAFNPYQNYLIHLIFETESDGEKRLKKSDEEYLKSRKR